MFNLKITIDFDNKESAKTFFKSIEPELVDFSRSTTKISGSDKKLVVNIVASDKTAMRASLNSIMKPLKLFQELGEL